MQKTVCISQFASRGVPAVRVEIFFIRMMNRNNIQPQHKKNIT